MRMRSANCIRKQREDIQRETRSRRKNFETTLRVEGSQDSESGGVSRSCAYAGGDSTETVGIEFHGVLEGKEPYDAV